MGQLMSSIQFDAEYLVFLKDVLVSFDVGQAVLEFNPTARVHQMRSLGQVLTQVRDCTMLRAVFMNVTEAGPTLDPGMMEQLMQEIEARGARLVLVGAEEQALRNEWIGLPTPFTSDTISALLARLDRDAALN